SHAASITAARYGTRSVRHCPGSALLSLDRRRFWSAHWLTVSSGGGARIFASAFKYARSVLRQFRQCFVEARSELADDSLGRSGIEMLSNCIRYCYDPRAKPGKHVADFSNDTAGLKQLPCPDGVLNLCFVGLRLGEPRPFGGVVEVRP